MHRALVTLAIVFACVVGSAAPAHAASRDLPPALPFYVVGHLLAPVGHLVGLVVVEPIVFVVENVPYVFELD